LEFVQTDVLARYHRVLGEEVLLLSGSDDNAIKNVQAAQKEGIPVKDFIEKNTSLFQDLLQALNISVGAFQRGSDTEHHLQASQKLWELCDAAGDIYKKPYEGLYCIGCEAFYIKDELNEEGECFEHPGIKLDVVSEENYFFRLSKYQKELVELVESNTLRILPETKRNEVLSFLKQPLEDISISRSNERAKNWGVPVPGDDSQRIYVWFDALNIYQSGVGFNWDKDLYEKWWPADVHIVGKGITRFHAVYWSAFLLSAKLLLPKSLFVHGYFTVDGQKMSKTLGNVIDPLEVIEKYETDPVRYFLLREIPSGGDGDFSIKKLEDRYNGDLANGLGNLIARVATLGEKVSPVNFDFKKDVKKEIDEASDQVFKEYENHINEFRLNEALADIWKLISLADRYINDKKPWAADEEELRHIVINAGYLIGTITNLLEPFLPETSKKIREQVAFDDSKLEFKKGGNLFPRL
jgi:methionyl-tRNA synthetase